MINCFTTHLFRTRSEKFLLLFAVRSSGTNWQIPRTHRKSYNQRKKLLKVNWNLHYMGKTTRTPQIKHTKSNRKRCQKKYSPVVVLFHPQRYFLPFFIVLMVTHICWNQQKWRRMRDWGQNYVIKVQAISAVKWETRGWWQLWVRKGLQ